MKTIASIFIQLVFIGSLAANNWLTITTPEEINEIIHVNDKYYVASTGGLLVLNEDLSIQERFVTANGIPSNVVEDVVISESGNIWIGTYDNGVAKFNGSEWSKYPIPEDIAFNTTFLYSIAVSNNIVYAATSNGVMKLENNTWEIMNPLAAWDFAKAPNGDIWVGGTFPGTIVDGELSYFENDSIFAYGLSSIAIMPNGDVLYGSDHGAVSRYSSGSWELQRYVDGKLPFADRVLDIEIDVNNVAYTLVENVGIFYLLNGSWQQAYPELTINWSNYQLHPINYNNILLGAKNGFTRIQAGAVSNVPLSYKTMPSNTISSIVRDGEKMLVRFHDQIISFNSVTLDSEQLISPDNTTSFSDWFLVKQHGSEALIYVNPRTGYWSRNGDLSSFFDSSLVEMDTYVRDVFVSSNNVVWIATGSFVHRFENGNHLRFNSDNSPFTLNSFWKIAEDRNGDIWVAGPADMCKWHAGTWSEHYSAEENDWAFGGAALRFYFDENNLMYHCSWANGLTTFDGATWMNYYPSNSSLDANSVTDIAEIDGEIILTTKGGVATFEDGNFSIMTRDNSRLSDNVCQQIVLDAQNNWWIVAKQGINIYNKNGVFITSLKKPELNQIEVYPNPTSNFVSVKHTEKINKVEILDLNGALVLSKQMGSNFEQIGVSHLQPGVYFMILSVNTKEEVHRILLK